MAYLEEVEEVVGQLRAVRGPEDTKALREVQVGFGCCVCVWGGGDLWARAVAALWHVLACMMLMQ